MSLLEKYPIGPIHTVELPKGQISVEGQAEIVSLFEDTVGRSFPQHEFEWIWATNRGTLPKRLASYAYKNLHACDKHGRALLDDDGKLLPVVLTSSMLTRLGNIAKRHTMDHAVAHFDLTDEFDWTAGQYGDSGSCFWGGRAGALHMLKQNNALAMRAYKLRDTAATLQDDLWPTDRACFEGTGRVWLWPKATDEYILFNGYGSQTLWFTRLLAYLLGLNYRSIDLMNRGTDSGTLFINNSMGYLVAERIKAQKCSLYDFGWMNARMVCEDCHREHDANDTIILNHRPYCEYCAARCPFCKLPARKVDLTIVGQHWICASCVSVHTSTCQHCQKQILIGSARQIDGQTLCRECMAEMLRCMECNKLCFRDDMRKNGPYFYCASCHAIKMFTTDGTRTCWIPESSRQGLLGPCYYRSWQNQFLDNPHASDRVIWIVSGKDGEKWGFDSQFDMRTSDRPRRLLDYTLPRSLRAQYPPPPDFYTAITGDR